MKTTWKGVFSVIGIIVVIYLAFRYVIPIIFKAFGWILTAAFYIIMWIAIGFFVVILIGYIVRIVKNR